MFPSQFLHNNYLNCFMHSSTEQFQILSFETRNSKVVTNTILSQPFNCRNPTASPKQEGIDSTEECLKIDQHHLQANSIINLANQSQQMEQPSKEITQNIYLSKRKTMLRIIKVIKLTSENRKPLRKYLVQYRLGSLAKRYKLMIDQAKLLDQDPQLLIEYLTKSKRVINK